jgi:hypothetical protein
MPAPIQPDPTARGHAIRSIILAELASRDLSRTWLAKRVAAAPGGCTRDHVMRYLRGHRDATGHNLHLMFEALGLHLIRLG